MKVIGLHSFALFSLRALLREQHVTDRYKNKIENQLPLKIEYAIDSITVKIKIGEICRKRYLMENQSPRVNKGNEAHHTIISGNVMLCRKDVSCQGNGAKSK